MHRGIETRLRRANDAGGIHGRRLKLVALDDGYEPERAKENVTALIDEHRVFAFIGNMGTLTAEVTLPIALEHQTLCFAGFTGADLLARSPPDRYVFNFRPRYREESAAIVDFLIDGRRLEPEEVAVFSQEDSFGKAGARAVVRRLAERGHRHPDGVLQVHYRRNSAEVSRAVERVVAAQKSVKAVVMFATYRAAAAFVKGVRDAGAHPLFVSSSVVGTSALAETLGELGGKYGEGLIITEVVPSLDANLPAVLEFRAALREEFPEEQPSPVSLEGYVATGILLRALEAAGPRLDTDRVIATLESIGTLDVGIGVPCTFSPEKHQCSHEVWASRLDAEGRLAPIEF
jgi:ABC-type branched-subunit amino acid transport system substrate-binding protein